MTGPGGRSGKHSPARHRQGATGAPSAPAAFAVGGAAWVIAAIVGDGAGDGTTRFYLSELIWLAAQAALLIGTVALWQSRPHGDARTGDAGFAVAALGRAAFVGAEVAALAAGTPQDALLPIAALLTAVGMVVAGIAVLRAGRWAGWRRLAPLAAGAYPFFAMFPFAAAAEDGPPALALGAWGIVLVCLGLAARAEGRRAPGVTVGG